MAGAAMSDAVKALLTRLEAQAEEQANRQVPIEERYLLIGPATGQFLQILVEATRARQILEIGTSAGYSSIWLGLGARQTGGRVTTLEISPYKVELARRHLREAGLADVVEILPGDARETLTQLAGPFDFVFIDAWKDDYAAYLDAVYPKVVPGGLIVADNIISHQSDPGIQAYVRRIRAYPDLLTVTVPIGSGEELTYKRR